MSGLFRRSIIRHPRPRMIRLRLRLRKRSISFDSRKSFAPALTRKRLLFQLRFHFAFSSVSSQVRFQLRSTLLFRFQLRFHFDFNPSSLPSRGSAIARKRLQFVQFRFQVRFHNRPPSFLSFIHPGRSKAMRNSSFAPTVPP
jgi:hypothetical protein